MTSYTRAAGPIRGKIFVPGDKSISHRALILGTLAKAPCQVTGLLEAHDVLHSAACLRALGASIEKQAPGRYQISAPELGEPDRTLYAGNAGTAVRLLMGAISGLGLSARFDGDASLRKRPMGRVLEPLQRMGVTSDDRAGLLPVILTPGPLEGISYRLPKPSAQVKSAILLAGLGAQGDIVIEEPQLSRDHTERMLEAFGVEIRYAPLEGAGRRITMRGRQSLTACDIDVPGDPSSAAFPLVAALITPGSELTVSGVMVNAHRAGLYTCLREMGADIHFENPRALGGEEIADLTVRYSGDLQAIEVPAGRAPAMIDEYPILAIAAATARGDTLMTGIAEMRVKESDRIAAIEAGLRSAGIEVSSGPDWLRVRGMGGQGRKRTPEGKGDLNRVAGCRGKAVVQTHLDHRIAMSFLVLGLISETPVPIDSIEMIDTSFPGFVDLMREIGAPVIAGSA